MMISPMQAGTNVRNSRRPIANSMLGNSAMSLPSGMESMPGLTGMPSIPGRSDFDQLGQNEYNQQAALGQSLSNQIGDYYKNTYQPGVQGLQDQLKGFSTQNQADINAYGTRYQDAATKQRATLAQNMLNFGQEQFNQQNPALLEDLNRRGMLSSPTEVANSEAQAMKEINLANQPTLNKFDQDAFNEVQQISRDAANASMAYRDPALAQQLFSQGQDIQQQGLNAKLSGQQEGVNSELELQRMKLQNQIDQENQNAEMALSRDLAKQQKRNSTTNALIGAGGSLLGGALPGILGGGGGTTAATSAGALGSLGGLGTLGLGALGVAAKTGLESGLGQELNKHLFGNSTAGRRGAQIGATTQIPLGGVIGAGVGAAAHGVKKAARKLCFDANTPIKLIGGIDRRISDIALGDRTPTGIVVSIRQSITEPGTRFNYNGVTVTGSHAVRENGRWLRVEDSTLAKPIEGGGTVYSLVTSDHRLYVNDITFADEHESPHYETLSITESLAYLNDQEDKSRNELNPCQI